jgi:hypothetical protein
MAAVLRVGGVHRPPSPLGTRGYWLSILKPNTGPGDPSGRDSPRLVCAYCPPFGHREDRGHEPICSPGSAALRRLTIAGFRRPRAGATPKTAPSPSSCPSRPRPVPPRHDRAHASPSACQAQVSAQTVVVENHVGAPPPPPPPPPAPPGTRARSPTHQGDAGRSRSGYHRSRFGHIGHARAGALWSRALNVYASYVGPASSRSRLVADQSPSDLIVARL